MSNVVDEGFETLLMSLKTSAAVLANGMTTGASSWMVLSRDGVMNIDYFDNIKVTAQFNRDRTSKDYTDTTKPENVSSFKVAQVAKIQGDVLSQLERDYRARYKGRVRTFAHAVAREYSHGLDLGPVVLPLRFINLLMSQV